VRKLSAKQITVPQAYDALKNAQPGGPYDKALGPLEQHDRCGSDEALLAADLHCLFITRSGDWHASTSTVASALLATLCG